MPPIVLCHECIASFCKDLILNTVAVSIKPLRLYI